MQTMPSKTRMSIAVAGAAALVLVVALIAYGLNQRTRQEANEADPMSELAGPANGVDAVENPSVNVGSAAPDAGLTGGTTRTDEAAGTGTTEEAGTEGTGNRTTQALNMMGSIPETHVVQPNETLYSISQKYYNTHIYAGDIERLNNLADPNQIQVGMELMLPRLESLVTAGQ